MPSDLSQLFQVAPQMAAYFTGQNQANLFQGDQLSNQTLEQQMQIKAAQEARAAELQPYEVQNKDLTNQNLAAQIPGTRAKSSLEQTNATNAASTSATDILAKNAQNLGTVEDEHSKNLARAQSNLLTITPLIQTTPGPFRKQVFLNALQQTGMNPEDPNIKQILNADPEQMPHLLASFQKHVADQKLALDSKAQAQMFDARTRADAEVKSAGIHAGATVKAAEISKEGRVEAAATRAAAAKNTAVDMMEKLKSGLLPPERILTAAQVGYANAQSETERDTWSALGRAAQETIRFKAGVGADGRPTLDSKGGITPRTVTGPMDKKPRGSGTADDPIVLK